MEGATESADVRTASLGLAVQAPGGEPAEIAALVAAPERPAGDAVLLFCVPGMTYRKEYWDFGPGYSFAAAAAAAGHVVVAVDNLGTGESSRPGDGESLSLAALAAANAEAAATAQALAAAGELLPGLPPLPAARTIGVGHSMGGGLVLLQQAARRSFAAIAVMGFSNQPLEGIYEAHQREAELSDAERLAWAQEHVPPKIWATEWAAMEPYFELPRPGFRELFYLPEIPAELIEADEARATVVPKTAAIETTVPGVSAAAAAAIDVPVFLAYGATDLSPDPLAEVATYPAAPEIDLLRLANSAHCHNLSPDRQRLWRRLIAWAASA